MSGPLAVTLDVSAVPPAPAGAGRYTLELFDALVRRDDVVVTPVARRGDAARWARPQRPSVVAAAPDRRPLRLAWEQLRLPHELGVLGPDVHHGPHYTMPERARLPVVVTIHDCTFFDHPEWHERSKVLLFRRAITVAARRATRLVCVSRTTAERLHEVCEVRAPVSVVPHGVDLGRFRADEPDPGGDVAALAGLGIDAGRPLVVFVGTIEPRKGVAGLIRAFDRIAGSHPDALLVLAGQRGWGIADVDRALAESAHADRVRLTGYVLDGVVPALLRRAAVVAYPSLEEGYGLPALEALACGAPLVTTAGTVMEEVTEGAALLVPPGDDRALAEAIDAVLGGRSSAGAHRERGLAVARSRTWAASAEGHVDAYRLATGAGGRSLG